MSDSYVILPDDSSNLGKKVDNTQVTVAGTDVQRQRVQIGGTAETDLVEVSAANGLEVDVTRVTGTVTVGDGGSSLSVDDAGGTLSIDDGGSSITVDGTVGVTGVAQVTGTKSVNLAVPGTTNIGVMPALANVASPTLTEGFLNPLSVDLSGALRVTGGTSVPSNTDDSTFTVASNNVTPVGYRYDLNGSDLISDNHVGVARMSANRCVKMQLMDGSADNEFGMQIDAAGRIHATIDSITGGIKVEVVGDVNHDSAISGNPVSIGGRAYDLPSVQPSAVASNDNVYATYDLYGRLWTATAGDVAHDAVDQLNPVKIGGQARQTNPTAVADADRVNAMYDDVGRAVVVVGHARDLVSHQHTEIASSSSETTVVTAGAAGVFNDIVSIVLTNQTATACVATIKDSTGGTTRMKVALAANGGAVITPSVPIPQLAAAANNWTVTLSSAAVTVDCFFQFVKNV